MCKNQEILIQDNDIISIMKYFDLALSNEELFVFEERMHQDIEFCKKVRLYEKSNAVVVQKTQTQKEYNRLEEWNFLVINYQRQKSKEIRWKWIGGIAAMFVLLIFSWKVSKMSTLEKLALDKAWSKKIGLDYTMIRGNRNDHLDMIIYTAYKEYENKQYELAIDAIDSFDSSMRYYEDALLIKGLAYYRLGQPNKALRIMELLSGYTTQKKAKVALWYRGLIYLDQGKIKKAKEFLELSNTFDSEIRLKK
ncbi:tetratricopeptide repeat protein [Aquimarina aquimarini]|uniref:tetratricopeptide repeat protein n=1 Tax=Aquimarina aquimarini TaxID=1191734 RepID=UPI00131EF042|nr:tetratricopeptide repeat protein [Aquimarina aquimarini]